MTTSRRPDMSITISTRNKAGCLNKCLASIFDKIKNVDFEVIVVDNGSTDGTAELLAGGFRRVKTILNDANLGMARARNQALRAAAGRHILILDDDTEILDGDMAKMLEYMDANLDIGVLGVKMTDERGNAHCTRRTLPGPIDVALRRLDRFAFIRKLPRYRRHHLADWGDDEILNVGMVIGAFQLIRRETFEKAGPLDERMFCYFEDIDFCCRCAKSGYRVVYYPHFQIWHKESREGAKSLFGPASKYLIHSFALYYLKHWRDISRLNRENPASKRR